MSVVPRPLPVDLAVDSSALISLLLNEPTSGSVEAALSASSGAVITTATLVEASMVAYGRFGAVGHAALDDVCAAAGLVSMPIDDLIMAGARDAFVRFGRGRHPAGLNFGDCFSYALARHFEVPLLCTGDDFVRTGLQVLPARAVSS
jgi:ribonuclease VapC